MALIDHFDPNAGTDPGQNGLSKLPVHEFVGSLLLFAAPAPVSVSKQDIIDFWSLSENPQADADELQLDQLIANYQALGTQAEQNEYIAIVENTLHFYQTGKIGQSIAKTWIGIT